MRPHALVHVSGLIAVERIRSGLEIERDRAGLARLQLGYFAEALHFRFDDPVLLRVVGQGRRVLIGLEHDHLVDEPLRFVGGIEAHAAAGTVSLSSFISIFFRSSAVEGSWSWTLTTVSAAAAEAGA